MVEETFQTDPISALGLPPPVCIGHDASVGEALAAVQRHRQGYVLIVDQGRPVGLLSEREVLMKIVARDVHDYERFVSERLSAIKGIGKIHSCFVLGVNKSTTALPL